MNIKFRNILFRYTVATVGLFLVALGVALSILSNLGTSSLAAPAYVLSGTFGLSVGNWTIIVNTSYILVQLLVMRKNFKLKYLMQIAATFVFGYLIDFALWCFGWMAPTTLSARILLCLAACVATAFGVSIEVVAQAWMLSAEMTVYAICKTFSKPFGPTKVAMDCCLVIISMVISYFMYSNPFGRGDFNILGILAGGSEGVVIGLGTLTMALLCGALMKFTDPIVDRMLDRHINKALS